MTEKSSHVEEVLAFIHDTKTWRDMEINERLEWCRRVSLVLADSTNERFGTWTQARIAPVLGVSPSVLSERLSWSGRVLDGDPVRAVDPGPRSPNKQAGDARRFFDNPAIPGERKAQILAEALKNDDWIAYQVVGQIESDPDLIRRVEKAAKKYRNEHVADKQPLTVDERWERWLTRINGLLTDGARLIEETDESTLGGYAGLALEMYRRITERQLDAEIRALLETQGVEG